MLTWTNSTNKQLVIKRPVSVFLVLVFRDTRFVPLPFMFVYQWVRQYPTFDLSTKDFHLLEELYVCHQALNFGSRRFYDVCSINRQIRLVKSIWSTDHWRGFIVPDEVFPHDCLNQPSSFIVIELFDQAYSSLLDRPGVRWLTSQGLRCGR